MSTTENLSRPGQQPADGDTIRVKHENGSVETKQSWTARTFPAPPKPQVEQDAAALVAKVNWSADDQSDALRLILKRLFP